MADAAAAFTHPGEPQTAEEYLRRVRYEAARCPAIVHVAIDPSKLQQPSESAFAEKDPIPEAPVWARPEPRWVRQFLRDFAALRQTLVDLADAMAEGVGVALAPCAVTPCDKQRRASFPSVLCSSVFFFFQHAFG